MSGLYLYRPSAWVGSDATTLEVAWLAGKRSAVGTVVGTHIFCIFSQEWLLIAFLLLRDFLKSSIFTGKAHVQLEGSFTVHISSYPIIPAVENASPESHRSNTLFKCYHRTMGGAEVLSRNF